MSRIINKIGFYCVAMLMIVAGTAYGEVYPTGKQQQLFQEPSFQTPTNWQVRTLPTGKKFQFVVYWRTFKTIIQTKDGPKPFSDCFDWAKDAIVRVMETGSPEIFQDLLKNKTNAILLWYTQRRGFSTKPFDDDFFNYVLKVKQAYGNRFLALEDCEDSWGGCGAVTNAMKKSCDELYHIPYPKNRDEGAVWFNLEWDRLYKKYQDAGVPIFVDNASSFNHYEGRKGVSYTGQEVAYMGGGSDPIYLAFCRGAARQYNIPWGEYASDDGVAHKGYFLKFRPDVRNISGGYDSTGPYHGPSPQQSKRTLYQCYMAGVNFYILESDPNVGMIADYDPLTVDQTEPRVLALQDKNKKYAGPRAMMWDELYENIVKKHDRGAPYTPIALLCDKNHGFVLHYSTDRTIGNVPYTAGDEQTRDMLNAIFSQSQRRGNYGGEIFDVLTTDASEPVIDSYRALVLVGDVRVSPEVAATLKRFVEKGGLLFMVCEQMTPELWSLAGISDTGQMGRESGYKAAYLRASDHFTYTGQGNFEYHKVTLDGAESLFVANNYEDRVWPVATLNRVGKGSVIVGTLPWLHHGKATNTTTYSDGVSISKPQGMHGLFSEIMGMIAAELVPVRVYGNEVKIMYNRNDTGWVVTLMNGEGAGDTYPWYCYPEFPCHKPAVRELSSAGVVLKPMFEYSKATEWLTGEKLAGKKEVSLIVPPGEVRVVEFREK
ncbi:MAG: hypothetical protein Q7J98_14280 [Kiritimatiellia bacterium]|nr:hypothetical protein [Kiritimatiellia bacterium]